jgi:hypothetical protein
MEYNLRKNLSRIYASTRKNIERVRNYCTYEGLLNRKSVIICYNNLKINGEPKGRGSLWL